MAGMQRRVSALCSSVFLLLASGIICGASPNGNRTKHENERVVMGSGILGQGSFAQSSSGIPRVPKCCQEGEAFFVDRKCHPSNVTFAVFFGNETEAADQERYEVLYGDPCKEGKFRLDPEVEEDYYELLPDGKLWVPLVQDEPYKVNEYCMESFLKDDGSISDTTFVCFSVNKAEQQSYLHRLFYPLGLLISVPFLLATVYVYTSIKELRDLHGKALCCYASCMAVAYLSLAIVQLSGDSFSQAACTSFAYIIQFSFVTCFFWLNVLCWDVCWYILAFTGAIVYYPNMPKWQFWREKGWIRVEEDLDKAQEYVFARKVFIGYSIYAWGLPTILLIIVIILDLNPALPVSYVKPNMGVLVCWFSNEQGALSYFYGPIGCILVVNIILFIITMYRICGHAWNPRGPQRTPKQRARMCLVLFLAMGISWIMEIISWAVGGPPYVWAVTDAFNVLQGVVIFIIFVMEPRVRILVSNKLCRNGRYSFHDRT